MNEILTKITGPIAQEMSQFNDIFREALSHTDGLLNEVLQHICQRGGKRMRPILTLLIAKNLYLKEHGELYRDFQKVKNILTNDAEKSPYAKALRAAASLELLHTASLVHDDVVDEADERRGQSSVNASYQNRIAVLVGDYILSTSLGEIAKTQDARMTHVLAKLGMTLSEGEVRQQQNISTDYFSIDAYYDIISKKTAALFESCCYLGALSVGASEEDIQKACKFGHDLGIIFQIRDDIFDYYDNAEIGKPTGNDMREGKLTLPVLYVLNNKENNRAKELAVKVKKHQANDEEISELIELTKQFGGVNYAREVMEDYYQKAIQFINQDQFEQSLQDSLTTYLKYVIGRDI